MDLMAKVNRIKITPELLIEANRALSKLAPQYRRDFTARGIEIYNVLVARKISPNGRLLTAISFRLAALARLEIQKHKEMRAWLGPGEDMGMVLAHEDLFKTAASEPLISEGKQPAFESVSFFHRLLAISTEHGRG